MYANKSQQVFLAKGITQINAPHRLPTPAPTICQSTKNNLVPGSGDNKRQSSSNPAVVPASVSVVRPVEQQQQQESFSSVVPHQQPVAQPMQILPAVKRKRRTLNGLFGFGGCWACQVSDEE